jgi:hypothetical protein
LAVGRRGFLQAVAKGAAGLAMAPLSVSARDSGAVAGKARTERRTRGYRETDHVRTYYERARL